MSCVCGYQAGKSSTASDNSAIAGDELDDSTAATRNRFVVVDDRLRGDEELAIAILEKAVLGETVLDRVVLEQLKAYIRGGGTGDHDVSGGGEAVDRCQGMIDGVVRDLDNLSVSSSEEEGDKFEDACGDVNTHGDTASQSDGPDKLTSVLTNDVPTMIRTPAEGLDAAAAQAQAKLKDRPITKGEDSITHSLPTFRNHLKTFCFRSAYPSSTPLLATCHQCALILLETSALYKLFTYLLTYLLT